jgi:hypothetical protein
MSDTEPANCMASIHRSTSPMCSSDWSISGPPPVSQARAVDVFVPASGCGSGAVVGSWSLLIRGVQRAVRQKRHSSPCLDFRDQLYSAWLRKPGRRSIYRCGSSVQTSGASSANLLVGRSLSGGMLSIV